uniref:putative manganese transporter n=1 Tax=Candidatus Merdicola sp. TaxID=3085652 RepID=UPI003FEFEE49
FIMWDAILDSLIDTVKLIPFLLITYIIMEFIEHKTSHKTKDAIKKSGHFGPLIGGILGVVPQCGFSAAASSLYSARIITLGTLIAVFLSTSDEMLPILISEAVDVRIILSILGIKLVIAVIVGFIIDLFFRKKFETSEDEPEIKDLCEHEHCHCEHGIFKSALKHTINITLYIFIISLVLNIIIYFIGEDNLAHILNSTPIIGPIIASLVGLIPNCASSVIITQLYLSKVLNFATMIAGLLVNTGVGLLILFRTNKDLKENIKITVLLFAIGVIFGIIFDLIGFNI